MKTQTNNFFIHRCPDATKDEKVPDDVVVFQCEVFKNKSYDNPLLICLEELSEMAADYFTNCREDCYFQAQDDDERNELACNMIETYAYECEKENDMVVRGWREFANCRK